MLFTSGATCKYTYADAFLLNRLALHDSEVRADVIFLARKDYGPSFYFTDVKPQQTTTAGQTSSTARYTSLLTAPRVYFHSLP